MEFSDVNRFFDTDPVFDGYTGASLFKAQTASFDDSSSDGATSRRRVLQLAPGLVIPTRRVVLLYGDRWVIGNGTPDGFGGAPVRQHFTMKRATDLLALLTPGQALAAAAGTPAYVQKMYFKDVVNSLTDSEYDTQWNIFVAPNEPAGKGTFLRDAQGRFFRVRNDYLPTEGLRVLQTDSLDVAALQTGRFPSGTYNPVTEELTAGVVVVPTLWMDVPVFYRFRHISDDKVQPGDRAVFVPHNLVVQPGDLFTLEATTWSEYFAGMEGRAWRVLTVQDEMTDAKALHVRLA
jgi:hypothetical protein